MAIRIRRTRRKSGERMRKYTPGTRTTTRTPNIGGGYTTTSSSTPGFAEYRQSPDTGGNPYPVISGASGTHAGMAILLATTLFMFATWKDFGNPLINSALHNQPLSFGRPFPMIIGGVVFIVLIGVIASTSSTGSDIMIWMLIAMWLLFMMFNGTNQMKAVFGWLQGASSNSTSNSTSSAGGTTFTPTNQQISNPGNTTTQGG